MVTPSLFETQNKKMKNDYDKLKGGDLRSIGRVDEVVRKIKNQQDFDVLFQGLFHTDRTVVMRTVDAIEKITLRYPAYLASHKKDLIQAAMKECPIEHKWHLALLVSRIPLTALELKKIWQRLTDWVQDKRESKIVRVNSLQSLFDLSGKNSILKKDFDRILTGIMEENIPSLKARIKRFNLKKAEE